MQNYLDREMEPSWFRVPQEAVEAVRKMLDPECAESYLSLYTEFQIAIPNDKRDCFLNIDFDAPNYPWSHSALSVKDFLTVFDPGDHVVAVIGQNEVLHKEDFASKMKAAGLAATEGNFNVVWAAFCEQSESVPSLHERAQAAVQAAIRTLEAQMKTPLQDQIDAAESRASSHSSSHQPPSQEYNR